jgi:hypothetical protein
MEALMSNELVINGQPVKIIEWNGQRVITTQEMAIHHNLETRILNQKFRRNQKYFTENIDYFIITKNDISESQIEIQDLFVVNNMYEIYLFTESGYLRFVKTINDDRAWEIYNQLIESYFLIKRLNNIEKQFLEKNKEHRKGLTSEWKEHEAKNYGMLTVAEYESLFQDTSIRKKQMDDKQLSLLSAFEFLECRKLENNPEIKGDNQLSDSMKDTGKKINGIIKKAIE